MKYIFSICILSLAIACTNPANETYKEDPAVTQDDNKTEPTTPAPDPAVTGENCYAYIVGKDTLAAKIAINGSSFNGTLVFDNFEKDGSRGTYNGNIENNILHGWYNFEAEGMKSVREIYFKLEGDQLITGIAEEKVKGDTAYVPDPSTVKYEKILVYTKRACNSLTQF